MDAMGIAGQLPPELDFPLRVLQNYEGLIAFARPDSGTEGGSSLGGQLVYAAELDAGGSAFIVAANIAGAATLAATADLAAQRQAVRDGVADFLVNSLDEALRILKNEVRKRGTVAVCVGLATEAVEREMRERGVVPDVIRSSAQGMSSPVSSAQQVEPAPARQGLSTVAWSVASAPALWLPRIDALILDCLAADAWVERRWLRLAPRFVGRMANRARTLRCESAVAKCAVRAIESGALRGQIGAPVEMEVLRDGLVERFGFSPAAPSADRA